MSIASPDFYHIETGFGAEKLVAARKVLHPCNKGCRLTRRGEEMARSSTTYAPKWRCGKTCVIRVPERIADEILTIAWELDTKRGQVREDGPVYVLESESVANALNTDKPVNVASVPQRSPFRYPGGKTWLVPILRGWLRSLPQSPGLFIEPFAGGGIACLTVAFERLADHVIMAETDEGVSSVWKTILTGQGEWLAKEILDFNLTLSNVRQALEEDSNGDQVPLRRKAFLTLLRNRVQRGGIMAPGAGLVKTGENNRGIRSRWYPETLARRIREINMNLDRVTFYSGDGFALVDEYLVEENAAFYVDPPYMKAARRLYRNWQVDHRKLFEKMTAVSGAFLMSYDNDREIQDMAREFGFQCRPVRMKNTHHAEMTELLISRDLDWLNLNGATHPPASHAESSRNQIESLVSRR
jgi:DNA adenine methylase